MIRGLSFANGVFFMGKQYIACATYENGKISDWIKPLNSNSLLFAAKLVIVAMPLWFKIVAISYFSLIVVPKLLWIIGFNIGWQGLPFYFLFYFLYGTHFFFPARLRQFHGAEHKVFSYQGKKTWANLPEMKKAAITNRYCSTNLVVAYFITVILLTSILSLQFTFSQALALASYASLVIAPIVNRQLNRKYLLYVKVIILSISYALQRKVTTKEPEEIHLQTALRSYRRLAFKEFPNEVWIKPNRKEYKKMAIVDITIIPLGTNSPSVSDYVISIHKVLETYEGRVKYQLTPMSTIIEGELSVLFEVIQALHEVPFSKGVQRVATNIRIDDRRDKEVTMEGKLRSIMEKE